jgi:hypothetical protein
VHTQITTRINWRHITVLRTNTIIYNASLHSECTLRSKELRTVNWESLVRGFLVDKSRLGILPSDGLM